MNIKVERNENAGCNNGEYHIYTVHGAEYQVCRCGNGCNDTTALLDLDKIVEMHQGISDRLRTLEDELYKEEN